MKRCYKCKETKPLIEFHKDKSKKQGVCGACRSCERERNNKRGRIKGRKRNKVLTRNAKYIYLITHPKFKGYVKIGRTINIDKRLSSYQTFCPKREFKVEYVTLTDNPLPYEWHFVDSFKRANSTSEWFEVPLKEAIKAIKTIKKKGVTAVKDYPPPLN